jgi:hypothetical protein
MADTTAWVKTQNKLYHHFSFFQYGGADGIMQGSITGGETGAIQLLLEV